MNSSKTTSARLRHLLGEEGFLLLCQGLGGTRLYVPEQLSAQHDLVALLGRDLGEKLSQAFAGDYLRVPMARRERALYWRAKGLSNARIALKLGCSEAGVEKIFARHGRLPENAESGTPTAQFTLF